MGKAKFIKLMALILALTFLVSGGTVAISAADQTQVESNSEEKEDSLAAIKELLNAISYGEYSQKYSGENYKKASQSVTIDAVTGYITTDAESEVRVEEYDGQKGLYTSSESEVSWIVNVPESAKYAIKIEYYPVEGKAASIERVFKINNQVPFGEARYLTLTKIWSSEYIDGKYLVGEAGGDSEAKAQQIVDEAKAAGLKATWAAAEETVQNIFGKNETKNNVYVYVTYPEVWTVANTEFVDKYSIRFFVNDVTRNELRPTAIQTPEWSTYSLRDSTGYYSGEYEFYLEAGENTLTLQGQNEPLAIKSITLYPATEVPSYEEYIAALKSKLGNLTAGADEIKLEAENMNNTSSKTIYAIEDRTSAVTSPADTTRVMLNTVGGSKWQTAGQWISFTFTTTEDGAGMYDIITRFRQNVLDGMFVCRSLQLYSEGLNEGDAGYYNGAPFAEAQKLQYNYDSNWQTTGLASDVLDENGETKEYSVYLAANTTYELRLEVTLGTMGDIVREVQEILDIVNDCYLEIIKLTGTNPDEYSDYSFSRVMPDVLVDMVVQSRRLDNDKPEKYGVSISQRLTDMAGQKSSNVGTLQKVARLLKEMGTDENEIAKNLESLKSYIGTLGTFLSNAKTQPLEVDYLVIRGSQEFGSDDSYQYNVKANANIFQGIFHEIKSFIMSFFRDYNSMGSMTLTTEEDAVEVWLATGRDQSQVIRNLINNDFTPNQEIGGTAVDLKLVAGGTLLPSILAQQGPDVYLGLDQASVINYSIRSALLPVDEVAAEVGGENEFKEVTSNFTDAAMLVLGVANPDGEMHYYGLPEAQGFTMMFVRMDILAELEIPVPETWDDVLAAIPDLQANNMLIGLSTDYSVYLYQAGGDLYADDGMRINLDSKKGLAAFEKMCNMFTQYDFPYQFDAANRFRTGEMPILIADYVGMYNQLKVFATEIEGLWEFRPMPGTIRVDEEGNAYVNNDVVSSVTASVMVSGCDQQKGAWNFMKWFTGYQCQADFSNEMVAIIGPAAKYNTANKQALENLPWTTAELKQIQAQFNNLASVPNYPGSYIIGRYTQFAFLSAYNDNANPSDALMSYITTINKEITRKRKEFGLETLEVDETLASKRMAQSKLLLEKLEALDTNGAYAEQIADAKDAILRQNIADLANASAAFTALYKSLETSGNTVDSQIASIKAEHNCYAYQVYEHAETPELVAYCLAEFLEDASVALASYKASYE